jgi:hypothetical protein
MPVLYKSPPPPFYIFFCSFISRRYGIGFKSVILRYIILQYCMYCVPYPNKYVPYLHIVYRFQGIFYLGYFWCCLSYLPFIYFSGYLFKVFSQAVTEVPTFMLIPHRPCTLNIPFAILRKDPWPTGPIQAPRVYTLNMRSSVRTRVYSVESY